MLRRIVRGSVVALACAGVVWSGSALATGRAQPSSNDAYPLQPGCVLVVVVRGEHPRQAIDRLLALGARVSIEYQPGGVVEVVSEELGLHEDDERWGELVSYDGVCSGDGEPI